MIIGINTAISPGAGKAQSVFRPHIHISLFPTTETKENNIEVTIGELKDFVKSIGINQQNKYLLSALETYLERNS